MTIGQIVAAEVAWPIVIDGSNNTLEYSITVSGVPTDYTVTLTPGTYWAHKLKVGLPNCFATHVANRIQAVTGQTTTAQRGLNGSYGAPALRFVHPNPAVTSATIYIIGPPVGTVPIDLFGWHYNDSALGQWSEHIPGGSFMVVDGKYSQAFRNTRIVEWRPKPEAMVTYMHGSPNATRSVSDIVDVVDFEASGVSAPFVREETFDHSPTLLNSFPGFDLGGSRDCSLDNLWDYDTNNLRYVVQLDNVSNDRVWWAPCSIMEADDLRKWSTDEPAYPGEYYRVRLKIRLHSQLTAAP
jgi:hypothetical protein